MIFDSFASPISSANVPVGCHRLGESWAYVGEYADLLLFVCPNQAVGLYSGSITLSFSQGWSYIIYEVPNTASSPTTQYQYGVNVSTTATTSTPSINLPPNHNLYYCALGTTLQPSIGSVSWTVDSSNSHVSIGHQTSNTCSAQLSGAADSVIAGIGVNYTTQALLNKGSGYAASAPYSYTLSSTDKYTYIVISAETTSSAPSINSIGTTFPAGCYTLGNSWTYIYTISQYPEVWLEVCPNQVAGSYSGTISLATNTYYAWAVYEVT